METRLHTTYYNLDTSFMMTWLKLHAHSLARDLFRIHYLSALVIFLSDIVDMSKKFDVLRN